MVLDGTKFVLLLNNSKVPIEKYNNFLQGKLVLNQKQKTTFSINEIN
jgi:hypothetical protein